MMGLKLGDKGQRYEVRYTDNEGIEKVVGWVGNATGAADFVKAIEIHPSFHSPKVIDRKAKQGGPRKCTTCGGKRKVLAVIIIPNRPMLELIPCPDCKKP